MSVTNRILPCVSAFFLGCISLLCGACARPGAAAPVKVGYLPIVAHLPAAVAEHQKLFSGLPIQPVVFGSSNDLLSALVKGEVDVATTVAVAPVLVHTQAELDRGNSAKVLLFSVSVTKSASAFDSIFVLADSPIRVPSDLAGKRIGVFPGTTAKNMLSLFLRKRLQIDPAGINWAFLPPNVQLAQLRSKDIDALYTYETTRTSAELAGMRLLHGSVIASLQDGAPFGCSAINAQFAREHPDVAKQYIEAYDQGVGLVTTNEPLARQILQTALGLGSEVARQCHLEVRLRSTELAQPTSLEAYQAFGGILRETGELKSDISIRSLLWAPQ
jgi:ABC-type nitrate/sulfonate/bicarbonate transport system substrate-binding protein